MRNLTKRRTLRCEALEGRDCPAVDVFASGSVLVILGDEWANDVTIVDNGGGNVAVIGDGETHFFSGGQTVAVVTFGGNDTVAYHGAGNATFGSGLDVLNVYADLGDGDDNLLLNGFNLDRPFNFFAAGGTGDDTMTAVLGGVRAGAGTGVFLDGGLGNDSLATYAQGQVNGELRVIQAGSFGSDTVNGAATVTADSFGRFDFISDAGPDDDNLSLFIGGDGVNTVGLTAVIEGGPGFNTGTSSSNVIQSNINA
jgi:hypothetical protein